MTEAHVPPPADSTQPETDASPRLSSFAIPKPQFELRLSNYEGPLDVLLRLIEEQRLQITAVSLATVADQFVIYLREMPRQEPQTIANFLSIAAKLILIKSRALLPQAVVPAEEQDETDDLVSQLRAYQLFKRAATILKQREHTGLRSFAVQSPPIPRPQSKTLPLDNVSLEVLTRAMQRVVDRLMPLPPVDDVMPRLPFTVNDCMNKIQSAVKRHPKVTFTELLDGVDTRVEVVITLLALLELLKRYAVCCFQEQPFGEIYVIECPLDQRPGFSGQDAPPEVEFVG